MIICMLACLGCFPLIIKKKEYDYPQNVLNHNYCIYLSVINL